MSNSKQGGGFFCRFVEKPKELQIECMICLGILKDPHMVDCCGIKFCQLCIKSVATQNIPCLNCQSRHFSFMPDKQLKRQLDERQVYCSNEKRWCTWKGQLKQLAAHLDEQQTASQNISFQTAVCQYQDVPCPRCRTMVQRKTLQSHIKNTCPQRDIPCLYEYAGCKDKVRQTTMETHLQKNVKHHSQFLGEFLQRQTEELNAANRTIGILRGEIETLKRELSAKIDENTKKATKVEKETKVLKKEIDSASTSTQFVRWLLIVTVGISLAAVLFNPVMSNNDKFLFSAIIGGVLVWLLVPNCIS